MILVELKYQKEPKNWLKKDVGAKGGGERKMVVIMSRNNAPPSLRDGAALM